MAQAPMEQYDDSQGLQGSMSTTNSDDNDPNSDKNLAKLKNYLNLMSKGSQGFSKNTPKDDSGMNSSQMQASLISPLAVPQNSIATNPMSAITPIPTMAVAPIPQPVGFPGITQSLQNRYS